MLFVQWNFSAVVSLRYQTALWIKLHLHLKLFTLVHVCFCTQCIFILSSKTYHLRLITYLLCRGGRTWTHPYFYTRLSVSLSRTPGRHLHWSRPWGRKTQSRSNHQWDLMWPCRQCWMTLNRQRLDHSLDRELWTVGCHSCNKHHRRLVERAHWNLLNVETDNKNVRSLWGCCHFNHEVFELELEILIF